MFVRQFIRPFPGLVLLALAGGCSKAPKEAPPIQGDHSFAIVYSQSDYGNIEPCSCNNRTKGGFPRRQTVLKDLRAKYPKVLAVDAGDSLFPERFDVPEAIQMPQAKVKAKAIAHAFVKTGLDAYTFGELDLRAGGNYFREIVKESGLPVLAANVVDRNTGKPLFERYKIFDLDGVKVAVIGLVSPQLKPMASQVGPDGSVKIKAAPEVKNLEDMFEDHDVKFDDPVVVAQELVAQLRGEAHLIVVLSHLSPKMSQGLPNAVPGVDFVIGNHKPVNDATYTLESQGLYMSGPANGVILGVADFHARNGSLLFADHTRLEKDRAAMPFLKGWREDIKKQYGTDDPDALEEIDEKLAFRMQGYIDKITEFDTLSADAEQRQDSYFKNTSVQLDSSIADDPELLAMVRDYRKSLKSLYSADDTARSPDIAPVAGQHYFVTDAACKGCHQQQYDFWQKETHHGKAWQTMLDYDAQYDLECIVCHTVGYLAPGGWDRPDRTTWTRDNGTQSFVNVQCEDCHGPGSAHVSSLGFLDENTLQGHAGEMRCEHCHNHEHSPNFKRETFVPRVSCPPIDQGDPLMRGLYANLLEAAKKQITDPKFAGRMYPVYVDICMRLERFDDALAAADKGFAEYPQLRRLRIASARALDGLGRTKEGLERLHALYDEGENAKNPLVVKALVDMLLHGHDPHLRDPQAALELCNFAVGGIGSKDPEWARLRAESMYTLGQRQEAKDYVKKVSQQSGALASELTELLQRWRSETYAREEYRSPPPIAAPPSPN